MTDPGAILSKACRRIVPSWKEKAAGEHQNALRFGDRPAYLEILEQVVHTRLDVEGVQPQSEDASLALAFSVKLFNDGLLRLFEGLETGPGVEEVGDEGQVELGVAGDHRAWGQVLAASDAVGILEHGLGALQQVGLLQGRARTFLGFELVEQDGVVLAVSDVFGEVVHAAGPVGGFEVEVEPAEEDLVRWQAEELLEGLVVLEQSVELGVDLDVDLAEEAAPDDLPDEAENEVLSAV